MLNSRHEQKVAAGHAALIYKTYFGRFKMGRQIINTAAERALPRPRARGLIHWNARARIAAAPAKKARRPAMISALKACHARAHQAFGAGRIAIAPPIRRHAMPIQHAPFRHFADGPHPAL